MMAMHIRIPDKSCAHLDSSLCQQRHEPVLRVRLQLFSAAEDARLHYHAGWGGLGCGTSANLSWRLRRESRTEQARLPHSVLCAGPRRQTQGPLYWACSSLAWHGTGVRRVPDEKHGLIRLAAVDGQHLVQARG